MCDLIDHQWLFDHMVKCGDDPLRWTNEQKDEAADQALHNCWNRERLAECMEDFFNNKCLEALYQSGHTPFQQAEIVRNEIWCCLESDIVDQCYQTERNRTED